MLIAVTLVLLNSLKISETAFYEKQILQAGAELCQAQ